jgi:predicted hydrocarbon binding protein
VQRETSAYEALHLALHGRAFLAEALLDRHGKQGEFIAYDIVKERRCAAVPAGGVTISEFMRRNADSPGTRNMFTAGLEVETVSTSPTEDVFRVHHCAWARYFREKHPRVGYLMACSTDEAFARASNPALRLQRTSTLMEGGEFCDFRYYAVEEEPS